MTLSGFEASAEPTVTELSCMPSEPLKSTAPDSTVQTEQDRPLSGSEAPASATATTIDDERRSRPSGATIIPSRTYRSHRPTRETGIGTSKRWPVSVHQNAIGRETSVTERPSAADSETGTTHGDFNATGHTRRRSELGEVSYSYGGTTGERHPVSISYGTSATPESSLTVGRSTSRGDGHH
jgi:hypothetical protein